MRLPKPYNPRRERAEAILFASATAAGVLLALAVRFGDEIDQFIHTLQTNQP